MIKRNPFEFLRGLALFAALWILTILAARLQLMFPRSLIVWLSQSPNPQQALFAFGALFSSGALILLRLGIEVPSVKSLITSEVVRVYFTGLPIWLLGMILAAATLRLLFIFPLCQPPASIVFHVEGRQESFYPNDTLIADPGDFLALSVKAPQDNSILSCKWQYIGETFESIGASDGCAINLKLSGKPGNGLLTLQVSQNFCNQSSVFSLGVRVQSP